MTTISDPLASLSQAGVSIWLDELSRTALTSGALAADVAQRHVVGVTTNPSIFQAALAHSDAYATQLSQLAARKVTVDEAVRMITTSDVRDACDVLRPVFDASNGQDGRVSIEVDPRFARDTAATIAEAKQLWWLVDRPNAMIKIPATVEGLPAITEVIAAGISVNVTLIFSLDRYAAVIDAYLAGLDAARLNGIDLSSIRSVASFFISRVDAAVDAGLDHASKARGTAAVANARLAYELHTEALAGDRYQALLAAGAHPQRPLWASTSVKDPAYPDTMYVDQLVAAGVVNTMPPATLAAVADHGAVPASDTISGRYEQARSQLAEVESQGVTMASVTDTLEREGVDKFVAAWQQLLDHVAEQLTA